MLRSSISLKLWIGKFFTKGISYKANFEVAQRRKFVGGRSKKAHWQTKQEVDYFIYKFPLFLPLFNINKPTSSQSLPMVEDQRDKRHNQCKSIWIPCHYRCPSLHRQLVWCHLFQFCATNDLFANAIDQFHFDTNCSWPTWQCLDDENMKSQC